MPHIITFVSSHRSITNFEITQLPDFTIITGKNGSGKSHFLEALMNRCIKSTSTDNQHEIVRHDFNSLSITESQQISAENLDNKSINIYNNFQANINLIKENSNIIDLIKQYKFPDQYLENPLDIIYLSQQELKNIDDQMNVEEFLINYKKTINIFESQFLPRQFEKEIYTIVKQIAEEKNCFIFQLKLDDYKSKKLLKINILNIFQNSFSEIFLKYNMNKQNVRIEKSKKYESFNQNEFEEIHGKAPWVLANEIFENSKLDFEIDHPDDNIVNSYKAKLIKKSNKKELNFNDLSSGEKIIMSFALCLFGNKSEHDSIKKPKLILFDEIDAMLHPSMSKHVLNIIEELFIKKYGIMVILVTHSPTTVAIGPEEAIYTMTPGKLQKSTKSKALNILTEGIPTVAISFNGRRQVFVESENDKIIYNKVYEIYKNQIEIDRSLEFISPGVKNKNGTDVNTGCSVVKILADELNDKGVKSVYGLIDWDNKNEPSDHIIVNGYKLYDGLENIMLDPLLIGVLLARNYRKKYNFEELLGTDNLTPKNIINIDNCKLEKFAEYITKIIFGNDPLDHQNYIYKSGLELKIDKLASTTDDHIYFEKIIDKIPCLKDITKNKSNGSYELMKIIVDHVFKDEPGFIPKAIIDSFDSIIKSEHP